MTADRKLLIARVVSTVAATFMALACGSNYVYSAWGPQFAEKLKLSSTEGNLVGASGNLGMYLMGIPVGIIVDAKGPRLAALLGAIFLAVGYFPLHWAYDRGEASVFMLCVYSFCTGMGGCGGFAAAIKTSALNWPEHRGTATAFPLAAFGLSAFFFSMCAHLFFPGSTGDFLLLLACGTSLLVLVPLLFLKVWPQTPNAPYLSLPTDEHDHQPENDLMHRTKSTESRRSMVIEPVIGAEAPAYMTAEEMDDTSSLLSKHAGSGEDDGDEEDVAKHHHHLDIRGLRLLPLVEFWHCFSIMGILSGIGLMTINNIGNDANALWRHFDPSVSGEFIAKRQAMHVSILSVGSFVGRLCSGVGSDILVMRLHASRYWCLALASFIFCVTQLFAIFIENPKYLSLVSSLTGLAYGFLFGVSPSLVAELFGIHGLSQNWGTMTLSPVISGNIFNLLYGVIFDHHSVVDDHGDRQCKEGLACYRSAYYMTFIACLLGLGLCFWAIHHEGSRKKKGKHAMHQARDD